MPDRSQDWFRQAERDLEQARDSVSTDRHERACFAAYQPAEKSVKALHLHYSREAWGHVTRRLLEEPPAPAGPPKNLYDKARVLDAFYIPTRYPNGRPSGVPFEHYGKIQSREAIQYAGEILEFRRSRMV